MIDPSSFHSVPTHTNAASPGRKKKLLSLFLVFFLSFFSLLSQTNDCKSVALSNLFCFCLSR